MYTRAPIVCASALQSHTLYSRAGTSVFVNSLYWLKHCIWMESNLDEGMVVKVMTWSVE